MFSALVRTAKNNKRRALTLSFRLTAIYALLFSAVLIALNAGVLLGIRYYLVNQAKSQVTSSAANTLAKLASSGETGISDTANLSEAVSVPEIDVTITDLSGGVLASSGKLSSLSPGRPSEADIIRTLETNDRHLVILTRKISCGGAAAGYLTVTYDMRAEYRLIRLLFVFMAAADAIGVGLAVLTGFMLSRRALRPIGELTDAARAIGENDLTARVAVSPAGDELSRLAETFNDMLERLRFSFEARTRFVSDASHELRTPVAVIKGYADLMARWGKEDPAVLDESITAVRREAAGMSSLIDRLLFLARGDSGRLKPDRAFFSAKELIDELVSESAMTAPDRAFAGNAPGGPRVFADRALIKRALRALISNSVKYTSPGGRIELTVLHAPEHDEFTVSDDGAGIPADDLPHVFDRFYRVDSGRSRESGGSGLGLAIVKQIAGAHGGSVRIASEQEHGTSVSVVLPRSDAQRE